MKCPKKHFVVRSFLEEMGVSISGPKTKMTAAAESKNQAPWWKRLYQGPCKSLLDFNDDSIHAHYLPPSGLHPLQGFFSIAIFNRTLQN